MSGRRTVRQRKHEESERARVSGRGGRDQLSALMVFRYALMVIRYATESGAEETVAEQEAAAVEAEAYPHARVVPFDARVGRQDHLRLHCDELLAAHGVGVRPDLLGVRPVIDDGPVLDRVFDVVHASVVACANPRD